MTIDRDAWGLHAAALKRGGKPREGLAVPGPATFDIALTGGGSSGLHYAIYVGEDLSRELQIADGCRMALEMFLDGGHKHGIGSIIPATCDNQELVECSYAINRQVGGKATHRVKFSGCILEQATKLFPISKLWFVSLDGMVRGRSPLVKPLNRQNGCLLFYVSLDLYAIPVGDRQMLERLLICPHCQPHLEENPNMLGQLVGDWNEVILSDTVCDGCGDNVALLGKFKRS